MQAAVIWSEEEIRLLEILEEYVHRRTGIRLTDNVTEWNKKLAIANRSRVSCAQYVEGIWPNYPVTLKSKSRVTQGMAFFSVQFYTKVQF